MDDRPTLLMLGSGEPMRAALESALVRHATFAEVADASSPVAAVMASAPDLVVLVGDAAAAYEELLPKFAAHPMTAVVPVALLAPADLEVHLGAARSGVALVPRTASADEMARTIASLARDMSERTSHTEGAVGEATLGELLDILRRELEGGILSVSQPGEDGGEGLSTHFVLAPGRDVDQAIQQFVEQIKPMLQAKRPLHYELDTPGTGKMGVLLEDDGEASELAVIAGARVLLIEDDAAVADALAQELRAHGATVAVCTSEGSGFERARTLDPDVLVVDQAKLGGKSHEVLRRVRRDPALRWAAVLVVRTRAVLPEGEAPRIDLLANAMAPLLRPDAEVREMAGNDEPFETRLEALGPSRLARAIAASGKVWQVSIRHPRARVTFGVAEGLVTGASATVGAGTSVEGITALAALLALGSGRVRAEPREAPASANLLSPVHDVFVAAAQESPPIRPSIRPEPRKIADDGPASALVTQLVDALSVHPSVPPDLLEELRGMERDLRMSEVAPPPSPFDAPTKKLEASALADLADVLEPPAPATTSSGGFDAPVADPEPPVAPPPPPPLAVPPPAPTPKATKPRRTDPTGQFATAGKPKSKKPYVPPTPKRVAPRGPRAPAPAGGIDALATATVRPDPPAVDGAHGAGSPTPRKPPKRKATLVGVPMATPPRPAKRPPSVLPPAVGMPVPDDEGPDPVPLGTEATVPAVTPAALPKSTEPLGTEATQPAVSPAALAPSPSPETAADDDDGDFAISFAPPAMEPAGESAAAIVAPATPPVGLPPLDPGSTEPSARLVDAETHPVITLPARRRGGAIAIGVAVLLALVVVGGALWYRQRAQPIAQAAANVEETEPVGTAPEPGGPEPTEPPGTEEPGTEPPGIAEPGSEEPGTEEPGTEEPGTEEPGTEEPGTDPGTEEPGIGEPGIGEPGTEPTEPATDPGETERATDPGETEPDDPDAPAAPEAGASRHERIAAYVRAGNFYRGRGNLGRARARYLSALRIAPSNGRALAGMAKLALAQNRPTEAVRYARRLVRAAPNRSANRILLGDALRAAGDNAGARRAWTVALRIDPRSREARRRLGQ